MTTPVKRQRLHPPLTRRRFLSVLAALPMVPSAVEAATVAARTPAATEGPFYPDPAMRYTDADNDLVRIAGRKRDAKGEVIVLKGRVLDAAGRPVEGARVEIWQCDANGRYLHSADFRLRSRDRRFQGFGHVVTGSDGAYAFRTIMPVPYPGRTPHIHVKAFHGDQVLTTQFYIANHPKNQRDRIFKRLSAEEQAAVSMLFRPGPQGSEATVDIVV